MVTVSPLEEGQLDPQYQMQYQQYQQQYQQQDQQLQHYTPDNLAPLQQMAPQHMAMGYWPPSEVVPGAGISSDEAAKGSHVDAPASDGNGTTVEASWVSGPNTDPAGGPKDSEGWATVAAQPKSPNHVKSPKLLKVEIPPKLPKGAGGDNVSKAVAGKKEPSPFLPLSPTMDQAEASWADEPTPDGLEPLDQATTFSWADQASTDFKASLARTQQR